MREGWYNLKMETPSSKYNGGLEKKRKSTFHRGKVVPGAAAVSSSRTVSVLERGVEMAGRAFFFVANIREPCKTIQTSQSYLVKQARQW